VIFACGRVIFGLRPSDIRLTASYIYASRKFFDNVEGVVGMNFASRGWAHGRQTALYTIIILPPAGDS